MIGGLLIFNLQVSVYRLLLLHLHWTHQRPFRNLRDPYWYQQSQLANSDLPRKILQNSLFLSNEVACSITPSTKQRLEMLEVTKRELEDKILIENMKRPLRTEDELWAWFRYMRNFDLTRLEERRQLIDVFVNTVFLYNDRFLLTLNFGYGSKTVLFTDIPCSDKVACGRPKLPIWLLFAIKSAQIKYVTGGCVP